MAERALGRPFAARIGANENAFGPSPKAVAAMEAAAGEIWMYADPENHDLRAAIAKRYEGEPFVKLVPQGQAPGTHHVRGSNLCLIGVFADRVPGRAILLSALDNLVKGASGQAVQNMNRMLGLEESLGLEQEPLFP